MKTKILFFIFLWGIAQYSVGQTFLWTKQSQNATVSAHGLSTDKYNNTYVTGAWSGSMVSFSPFSLNSTGISTDFLVKYDTAGNVKWAKCMAVSGTNCTAEGYAICTDGSNNIYETGTYEGNATLGTLSMSSPHSTLMFMAKYNSNGTPLWVSTTTTTPTDKLAYAFGSSVACDSKNNLIVTGTFRDTVYWGSTLLLGGSMNGFLAKYDSSGNILWSQVIINDIASPGNCQGSTVSTDAFDNIYASGEFTNSVYLGNDTLTAASSLGPSLYLAKYSPNGKLLWAQAFNAITNTGVTPVLVDRSNNVYFGGQFFNDTSYTAPLILGTYSFSNIYSHSGTNSFLAKLNPNGNVIWAMAAAPISPEEMSVLWIESLAIDKCNNVYWVGISSDSISIGTYRSAIPSTIPHGDSNHFDFVVKLDSMGNTISGIVLPDNDAVGTNVPYADIMLDSKNNIALCGQLRTSMVLGNDTVSSSGGAYITKFSLSSSNCCSGSHTPSITACCDTSIQVGQSVQLTSSGGVSYMWVPATGLSCTNCPDPSASPLTSTTYTLVVSDSGCSAQQIITIDIGCGNLFIPDAFSPNGDGQNDELYVRDDCIRIMDFIIWDRWGNKVFETTDKNIGWDGKFKGQAMNTGTFVYLLTATMYDGSKVQKKGSIALVR